MHTLARRSAGLASLLALAVAGASWAQQATQPGTAPVTAPAAGPGAAAPVRLGVSGKMKFEFRNAQIDTVLNAMSENFGFIIIKTVNMTQTVTVVSREELDATQAITLVNDILFPYNYGVLETRTSPPNERTILRVATIGEMKRAQIPVKQLNKAVDIPLSDQIITDVIALKNISAVALRNDLTPLLSA